MTVIPSEKDRERIAAKLEIEQRGRWKAMKSELHNLGKQALFFFLIEDPRQISDIIALFQMTVPDELAHFQETQFELSFIEIRDGKNIVWDVVDNEEIRGSLPPREWGAYPQQFDLGEDELFGEYVGNNRE